MTSEVPGRVLNLDIHYYILLLQINEDLFHSNVLNKTSGIHICCFSLMVLSHTKWMEKYITINSTRMDDILPHHPRVLQLDCTSMTTGVKHNCPVTGDRWSGNLFQNWNIDELYRQKRFFSLYGTFFLNFQDFLGWKSQVDGYDCWLSTK